MNPFILSQSLRRQFTRQKKGTEGRTVILWRKEAYCRVVVEGAQRYQERMG